MHKQFLDLPVGCLDHCVVRPTDGNQEVQPDVAVRVLVFFLGLGGSEVVAAVFDAVVDLHT